MARFTTPWNLASGGSHSGDRRLFERGAREKRIPVTMDKRFREFPFVDTTFHSGLVGLPDVSAKDREPLFGTTSPSPLALSLPIHDSFPVIVGGFRRLGLSPPTALGVGVGSGSGALPTFVQNPGSDSMETDLTETDPLAVTDPEVRRLLQQCRLILERGSRERREALSAILRALAHDLDGRGDGRPA